MICTNLLTIAIHYGTYNPFSIKLYLFHHKNLICHKVFFPLENTSYNYTYFVSSVIWRSIKHNTGNMWWSDQHLNFDKANLLLVWQFSLIVIIFSSHYDIFICHFSEYQYPGITSPHLLTHTQTIKRFPLCYLVDTCPQHEAQNVYLSHFHSKLF